MSKQPQELRSAWAQASVRCTTRPSADGRMGVAFNVPGQPVVRLSITMADARFLIDGLRDAMDHSSCAAGTQSPMSALMSSEPRSVPSEGAKQ